MRSESGRDLGHAPTDSQDIRHKAVRSTPDLGRLHDYMVCFRRLSAVSYRSSVCGIFRLVKIFPSPSRIATWMLFLCTSSPAHSISVTVHSPPPSLPDDAPVAGHACGSRPGHPWTAVNPTIPVSMRAAACRESCLWGCLTPNPSSRGGLQPHPRGVSRGQRRRRGWSVA